MCSTKHYTNYETAIVKTVTYQKRSCSSMEQQQKSLETDLNTYGN